MDEELKRKLADGGLLLERAGYGDFTRGHLSVRLPGTPDEFYMKAQSFGLDEIEPANIVTCNLDGEKVAGEAPRHSEVYIHSEIYRIRPDVNAVVHVHPKHAVAFSATGKRLTMISQPSANFADGLGVYAKTMDLVRTKAMGADVAASLGQRKATLMRNHGVAVVGRSIEEAVILCITLETACEIQLMTDAAGGPCEEFPHEDVLKLHDVNTQPGQYRTNFDYLVRKVKREGYGRLS